MPHRSVVTVTVLTCWIVVQISAFAVHKHENTSDLAADRIETVMHAAYRAFPSVTDIYPEIGTDLTRVTWAHGVDSRKKLDHTLRGSVMMIEADVALGKLKGEPHSANRPIMAHPPVTASDLTLEDFLDMALDEFQYKGIKLDIKSSDILEQALQITKNRENKIRVPLWLNADIVQGPGGSTSEPLNADIFLRLTKFYFPTAVISVGWKTRLGKDGSYTFDHVRNMRDVLRAAQITAAITFPIRAALSTSLESRENILWLLNQVPGSTVTIWSSFGDEVDVSALLDFIDVVGKEFVYIDVHKGLRCQISRYRTFRSASSWMLNTLSIGRTGKFPAGAGFWAMFTYMTCVTSFLPWNTDSYTQQ